MRRCIVPPRTSASTNFGTEIVFPTAYPPRDAITPAVGLLAVA